MSDRLKKWKPILDNVFKPYELENEILEMVADYLENNLENIQYTASLSLISPQEEQKQVFDTIFQFKERLCKDVDIRTDVKNVYYNNSINRIVYELTNGDSVYLETKPLVLRNEEYIERAKYLFLSISNPTDSRLRKIKINEIKNKL